MGNYYDMDGHPIELMAWARLMEDGDYRRLASDEIGDVHVSTVLLGIDHSFGFGPPLIFETMVFGYGEGDSEYQWRYSTKERALAGHGRVVQAVRDGLLTPDLVMA